MRYALNEDYQPIEVTFSGERAVCPGCKTQVYARRPKHGLPHWVHKSKHDCDSSCEPMTQWHIDWQDEYPIEWREKQIRGHRADVVHEGFVIEFQHSSLTGPQIQAREKAYRRMAWVIDVTEAYPTFEVADSDLLATIGVWSVSSSMIDRYRVLCRRPLFFDCGKPGVVHVHRFTKAKPFEFAGNGELMTREQFVSRSTSDWIRSASPIERCELPRRKIVSRNGRRCWDGGELGSVCDGTESVLNRMLTRQSESGFHGAESDNYYRHGM